MAPARQQRPAPENPPAPLFLEPFGTPGFPVPPPMFLAGGLAPYPPHYGVPGPYPAFATMPPPNGGISVPSPDTIFQGTVTNFGHFNKDGRASRHCYGFIKIDHSGNEVFVSEEDAPDGYLSQGDRCEFRIVDARTKNRRTGAPQWKATDVVCIQRVTPVPERPPALERKIQIKAVQQKLLELVEANGGRNPIQRLRTQYEQRYGQPLDVKGLGYKELQHLVADTPGLAYDARDASVRRLVMTLPTAAPEPPGELSEVARQLKAREQALRKREEALAKREADVHEGVWDRPAVEADVRALIDVHRELRVSQLADVYRRKYGRMLDYKRLGFAKLSAFVAKIPGLELVDGPAGSVRRRRSGGTVRVAPASDDDETAPREPGVSEAMRHLSLEPKRDESKTEPVPAGYTVVAAVLQHLDETRLLPTFLAQQIDDAALPYLEPTDLIELGVAPMTCLAILGASAAGGKQKKLETQDVLHDVATHQSVLEAELREHRREIARLRISREEVAEDLCCSITCELMKDPVVCVGDGHTYERVAISQWFATGARTSPTTNERLDNLTLVPNHTVRRLIAAELERRRDASGADETKGPS
jgi:cold shock CspA family protein